MISNLEYFRTFLYVANLHSFTKAAEYLYVSQSAVSQSIRKLEEELNCTLFLRNVKGAQLTTEGVELLAHVQRAIQELYTGENTVSKMINSGYSELKIGATETCLRYYLAPQLQQLKKLYPNTHITLEGANVLQLCQMLQNREIELAFLFSPIPEEYNFQLKLLCEIQDIPVVIPDYGIDLNKEYSLTELSHESLISVSTDNRVRFDFNNWFIREGIPFNPDYVVQNMSCVYILTKAGIGIGILPEVYVLDDIAQGKLIQLKTTSLPPKRQLYLATRRGSQLLPITTEFLNQFPFNHS